RNRFLRRSQNRDGVCGCRFTRGRRDYDSQRQCGCNLASGILWGTREPIAKVNSRHRQECVGSQTKALNETYFSEQYPRSSDMFSLSAELNRAVFLILLINILVGKGARGFSCTGRIRHQADYALIARSRSQSDVKCASSLSMPLLTCSLA